MLLLVKISQIHGFFYKKLGEGASSKSFLILVKILVFLVPSSKFLIQFLIIFDQNLHPMSDIVLNISSFFNFEHNTKT